ncbi:cytochrome c-type biogenesis protein [Marinomonas pollencensis]|uniref:Cytochrome c-type biogenesis protein n=1 Tax=Marinomonas pollencensis TaxID=491954 RepID=A0A3E0DN92_9GAMM|nr:cytochrome c-type biogenesis protein [Marinomonas pollencensis]REG82967.1 cytochrome c-type biogenesis protein CcmH [Marinomonas pollencensis]
MKLMKSFCIMVTLLLSSYAFADTLMTFSSELNQTRFQSLAKELRCPKCQNQDLADSQADIAKDLRIQIHDMIEQGKTDQEIVDYMVARYGDFVLYRPRYSAATAFLWGGPIALLLIGFVAFGWVLLRNKKRRAGKVL